MRVRYRQIKILQYKVCKILVENYKRTIEGFILVEIDFINKTTWMFFVNSQKSFL